jgi:DNA-binding response OmpR family regulator
MNVLIVEDEKSLAREIADFLKSENILSDLAFTGTEASEKIAINLYDFVLLDLGLPDYNGLDLITEARKSKSEASFIIITARGAVEDKVKGLNLGADDYLAKPFALIELLSRINAVARRKFNIITEDIILGDFVMKVQSRKLTCNGNEVDLTRKEFDLLQYLVLNQNKVLTRNQL